MKHKATIEFLKEPPIAAVTKLGERRKGVVKRSRKGDLDRVTSYLPMDVGHRLRSYAGCNRQDLSEVITEALRRFLP
jgi:hypothetical protein